MTQINHLISLEFSMQKETENNIKQNIADSWNRCSFLHDLKIVIIPIL